MTRKDIKIVQARIKEELANINQLQVELKRKKVFDNQDGLIDDNFFIRGIGSILHDYYVAVENVLKIACSELDENLPEGLNWHMDLLRQASLDLPEIRPAIISKETTNRLDKFRAFRHFFRNVYGFNLDLKRIKELLSILPETTDSFTNDINKFCKALDQLSEKDS